MQHVDRLTEPPTPGRFYLVPTVEMPWMDRLDIYPVIGPWHQDRDFFDFPFYHIHVDGRFLTLKQRYELESELIGRSGIANPSASAIYFSWIDLCQAHPLHWPAVAGKPRREDPPPIVYRRRKCQQASLDYRHHDKRSIQNLATAYAGSRLVEGAHGWVCPHRGAHLGSIEPDGDGVVTCPLHGLRFCAKAGRAVPIPESNSTEDL